jgi:hypothetical protein
MASIVMKSALTNPSKSIAKMAANQTIWARAAMFLSAVGLLMRLWILLHNDGDLAEIYTVYACALLLFAGMSLLWR